MPNYDFHNIFLAQPLRFQQFACAVASQKLRCTFQRFGAGPDGGVDGLYASENGNIILQAKCTGVKGRSLLGILRQEQNTMKDKACIRYILVLSLNSVSLKMKEEIQQIFPQIADTNDIISGEDLNGFLERPEFAYIERAYPELWLSSGNQLEEMLSKTMPREIMKRSRTKVRRMEEEQRSFVATKVFQEALELLEEYQRVIISGEPGAGKTMHADCLAHYYIKIKGYEELYFVNSLGEIERLLGEESGRKTVIIFDDFWGHNTFSESRIELNAERAMEEIFQSLKFYPNVRLILTTREFVLQQGLRCFTELEEACSIRKVNLNLSTYSLAQKAEILYRHLDASKLEYSYVSEIFKRGERIVRNSAYSPRSVAYYLQNNQVGEREPWEYAVDLEKYVRNPAGYFNSIFKLLSYGAKLICFLVLLSEEEIRVEVELKTSFMSLAEKSSLKADKEQYEEYLKELDGTFTKIVDSQYEDVKVLEFLNYSIRDFIKEYLNSNMAAFETLMAEGCIYFNHLYYLVDEMQLSNKVKTHIIERLVNERDQLKYTYVDNSDVDFWNYNMDAETYEYDANKMWQLLLLHEKVGDQNLLRYLNTFCDRLIEELNQNRLEQYGRECLINLIPRMCKNGYVVKPERLLEPFFRNIRWSQEIKFMEFLKPCCPAAFEEFRDTHMGEIRRRLPLLILEDIEYWIGELDGDGHIDELLSGSQTMMEQYGLEYTKSFEKTLYRAAERSVPKKRKSMKAYVKTAGEESEFEREERQLKAVTDSAREWLVPGEACLTSREIKMIQRAAGRDYRKGYLTRGKFTREDFSIVMEFLEHLDRLPADEQTFYQGLKAFLLRDWDEESRRQTEGLARALAEHGIFYFTEQTVSGLYEGDVASLTDWLLAAGLLHKTGKWYSFWNQAFMMYTALEDFMIMEDEEKEHYYQEEFWNIQYASEGNDWFHILAQYDGENFGKYLAVPYFVKYLTSVEQPGKEYELQTVLEKMELSGFEIGKNSRTDRWRVIIHVEEALEILSVIENDVVFNISAAYQSMLNSRPDDWDRYKTRQDDEEHVSIHTLLQSQEGNRLLNQSGCLEKAAELLAAMREYLQRRPS